MGGMHQSVDPFGNDRGVHGRYPLRSGIRLAVTEGTMWDRLHRKMYPNSTATQRLEMKHRMLRTLQADPQGPPMSKGERLSRMEQLRDALNRLPPDANNQLMRG